MEIGVLRTPVLMLALWLVHPTVHAESSGYPDLWRPVVSNKPYAYTPNAITHFTVAVDPLKTLQSGNADHFRLELPEARVLRVSRTRSEKIGKDGFLWHGQVDDDPLSSVTFSVVGDVVVGDIVMSSGLMYRLEHVSKGVQAVFRLDPRQFARDGIGKKPQLSLPFGRKDAVPFSGPLRNCPADDPQQIDAMVVYTEAACRAAANQPAGCNAYGRSVIQAKIYQAVGDTNESFRRTQIPLRLGLVHVASVGTYAEESTLGADWERLSKTGAEEIGDMGGSISKLDEVHDWRDRYGADVVMMVTRPQNAYSAASCGESLPMTAESATFEKWAFAAIPLDCSTGNFSFAHELGHMMGADHDVGGGPVGHPFPYSHGWANPAANPDPWMTLMSTGCSTCQRIGQWSNTVVNRNGHPMGSAATHDNRQTLIDTADTVANYRIQGDCRQDVWMKDTWQDSGDEPDLAQATAAMWKSPYIWVRNTRDPDGGFAHQHEHENPKLDPTQSNWVYVKLHNGGATRTGQLAVYFASASTALTWPTDWQLLSSTAHTLQGHRAHIAEIEWPQLPGAGHYCMVARWVASDDPMTTPEGPDITANVQNNNNIVWRNLNIVDLTTTTSEVVTLSMGNPGQRTEATLLEFSFSGGGERFRNQGDIELTIDDALYKHWISSGAGARGLEGKGPRWKLVSPDRAVLGPVYLPAGFRGELRLTFKRGQSYLQDKFMLDVQQLRLIEGERRTVGGVTYSVDSGAPR